MIRAILGIFTRLGLRLGGHQAWHGPWVVRHGADMGASHALMLGMLNQLGDARLVDAHVVDHLAHVSFMLEELQEILPVDLRVTSGVYPHDYFVNLVHRQVGHGLLHFRLEEISVHSLLGSPRRATRASSHATYELLELREIGFERSYIRLVQIEGVIR